MLYKSTGCHIHNTMIIIYILTFFSEFTSREITGVKNLNKQNTNCKRYPIRRRREVKEKHK